MDLAANFKQQTQQTQQTQGAQLAELAARCPDLCQTYSIDLREFVILAVLYSDGPASLQALSLVLELSATSVDYCLARLQGNDLAECCDSATDSYRLTSDALILMRRAHEHTHKGRPPRYTKQAVPKEPREPLAIQCRSQIVSHVIDNYGNWGKIPQL